MTGIARPARQRALVRYAARGDCGWPNCRCRKGHARDAYRSRASCRRLRHAPLAGVAPRTSYGYIRCGASLGDGIRQVERFVEKPDAATAVRYLSEGYVWNSGNFMFRADVLVSELERHAPQIAAAVAGSVENACEDLG